MTPILGYLAIAGVAVPVGGSLLLERTYRTDPWLRSLPLPNVTMTTHAVATACAVLLMICAVSLGLSPLAAAILGPLFGIALLTDCAGRVLPDLLTATIALVGLALALLGRGLPMPVALAGMIGSLLVFWLFRCVMTARHGPNGFALGDVKFLAASAAFLPIDLIAWAIMLACVIGLIVLSWHKVRPPLDPTLPFGSLFVGGFGMLTVAAPILPGFRA